MCILSILSRCDPRGEYSFNQGSRFDPNHFFNFWIMCIRIWHMQICRFIKETAKGQCEGIFSRHSRCSSDSNFLTWQRRSKFSFTHLKSFGHCISPMSCSIFFFSSSFMFFFTLSNLVIFQELLFTSSTVFDWRLGHANLLQFID